MRRVAVGALALVAFTLTACSGAIAPPARSSGSPSSASAPSTSAVSTTTQPPETTTTTQAPQPQAPQVEDLTWVSDTHGWAMVERQNCGQPTCTDVLTTTDGGSTWTQIGSIPATAPACTGCDTIGVSGIRFANDLDGYAFGPDLYVTTDGGVTWTQKAIPNVAALEPAGANVMRVMYTHTGCPGPCDLAVQVAAAGSSSWQTLTPPFQADGVQLVRQGTEDAYVAAFQNPAGGAGSAHATLMISHDGGVTWSSRPDPCGVVGGDEYDTSDVAAAPPSVVVVLCRDRLQFTNTFVALSTDGGATFTAQPLIPGDQEGDQIAATSATSIFLSDSVAAATGTTQYSLLSSDDGGRSWQQAASDWAQNVGDPPPPDSPFLGFESASVGRWVAGTNDVWQTSNGGVSWARQSVAS